MANQKPIVYNCGRIDYDDDECRDIVQFVYRRLRILPLTVPLELCEEAKEELPSGRPADGLRQKYNSLRKQFATEEDMIQHYQLVLD